MKSRTRLWTTLFG
ncbi:BnaC06g40780D [Brassica napus]|uniref:BnaC06g40780D protein n=1 Tax=Brassica napus TaxID=3708 RepID=A0A078J930_BRANA|nr:BnaC06g40780D [Brassica napus]